MSQPVLEYDGVTVRYEHHGTPTVEGVSLSVGAGERVALVGLNGSGKTTLLMAAVGLVEHEGAILVGGKAVNSRSLQAVRASIGFLFNVPEDQLLFPKVVDDTAFALVRKGMKPKEAGARAREVLEQLGVGAVADSPLHHLSHGQKQRVALAGALVTSPPLLLLDEPSAALDPPGKRNLAQLLASRDAAMVIATHDPEFAAALCTRYVLLEGGRIAYDGADASEVAQRL
ncbi:MAG TPA: ABC transporter ATP-binding protein [Thermoanaerobaculales bacterium]|nr:ABC transporter ATP-binding protein [Thermoanaerobaculales bacterium]